MHALMTLLIAGAKVISPDEQVLKGQGAVQVFASESIADWCHCSGLSLSLFLCPPHTESAPKEKQVSPRCARVSQTGSADNCPELERFVKQMGLNVLR